MATLLTLSAAFVSFAFWLGYARRTQEFHAAARAQEGYEKAGTWSLLMAENASGSVTVRAVFREPIVVDGVAVWPSGEMTIGAEQGERFERVLRQARERAEEQGK